MGQLLVARATGKKSTKCFHTLRLVFQNNKKGLLSLLTDEESEVHKIQQLIPGHKLVSGRTGTQIQVC